MEFFLTVIGILLGIIVLSFGIALATIERANSTGLTAKPYHGFTGLIIMLIIFPCSIVFLLSSVAIFVYGVGIVKIGSLFFLLILLTLIYILSSNLVR